MLVGEVTYRATRNVVEYREMRDVHAKGKQAPLRVWAAETARSRFETDLDSSPTTALVGMLLTETVVAALATVKVC